MSLVMLIGDTHIGHKNGCQVTADYQISVFDKFIFPLIEKLGIKHVIQTGDFFDSRKSIRHDTMALVSSRIAPKTIGQQWYVAVGNHDLHLRESIYPNSVNELLSRYDNFRVFNEPGTIDIDGAKIDIIPWICRDNRKQIQDFIKGSKSPIAVGHFELSGFQYYRGVESDGEDSGFLDSYQRVWSGHFHTISKRGHIQYVGTPYQLTFGDADDERGVWVYDTDTGDFSFYPNNMPRFTRVYFDHETFDFKGIEKYRGMFLKIVVNNRGATKKFDGLIDKLAKIVQYLDIVDGTQETISADGANLDVMDSNQIIAEYIDTLPETESDKKKIKRIVLHLYEEATKI